MPDVDTQVVMTYFYLLKRSAQDAAPAELYMCSLFVCLIGYILFIRKRPAVCWKARE